jgi:hypothetical protein
VVAITSESAATAPMAVSGVMPMAWWSSTM